MPKIYLLLLVLLGLFIAAPASAQLYDVRPGEVNYNKRSRSALKVQVDGKASDVRDFLQDWMKSSYNIRLKGGGLLGLGKSEALEVRQIPANAISSKLINLYAIVLAPADSVAEVSLFGGFDDNTFFDASSTATEYNSLRTILQNFASAARLKAHRDWVTEAEKKVKAVEKEKERLEKNRLFLQNNTTSNLARIEELRKKNEQNLLQSRADSVSLIKNAQVLDQSRLRLQQRRDRLSALDRKN
ncbi:hypothetical protein IC235_06595 [Hymenobacter sp. BT664]|uniref:DUF4468 domain-containing protein n=1 Tax=Hymenobacter montanus TaxID=2771359 RepID=A0A927BB87_9BACT|nr:hypothetical protein [Hymenobacter montanus]MBD2767557.1 hypothetical protein [Hymenobacter montanus]